jgi:AsmA-like C-terminal region
MAATSPRRRLKLFALVVLAWIGFGLMLPFAASLTQTELDLGASSQAADVGGYVVTAPVVLSHSPRISIERGSLLTADAKGRPLDDDKSAGRGNAIIISNGELTIGPAREGLDAIIESQSGVFVRPVLGNLARQNFTTVSLRRAILHITLPDGDVETLRDVTGDLLKRGKTGWQFKGSALVYGQRTAIDMTLGVMAPAADRRVGSQASVPLKFTAKSPLLDWQFDGRIGFGPALLLSGTTDVDVTVARQSSWMKRLLPLGLTTAGQAHNLKAKGDIAWGPGSMALSRATVVLDGSEATGALTLDRRPQRPLLSGTLAFQTLHMTRHLPEMSAAAPGTAGQSAGSLTAMAGNLLQSWGPGDLDVPFLTMLDADLRVSADRVELGAVTLRRTAASVSNTGGKLLADMAAFEFDGGRGSGQISGDFTGSVMRLGLRVRLDNLDAARATAGLFGTSFLDGRGTVTMELSGTGRSLTDVARSAQGRVVTGLPDGGRISVDLKGLAAASEKRAVEGWSAGGRDQMSLDRLDVTFALANGVLKAETGQARIRDDVIKFSGSIDMPSSRINLTAVGPFVGFSGANPNTLLIFGPWSHPTVRLEQASKAASVPTIAAPVP